MQESSANFSIIKDLLGTEPSSIEELGGGRNSRSYKITLVDERLFVAKFYFQHSSDRRDRLSVETSSFRFLWEHGIRNIPELVAVDRNSGLAVFSFIEGSKKAQQQIGKSDIVQLVNFIEELKSISRLAEAKGLPPASEACFSTSEILNVLESRFQKLKDAAAASEFNEVAFPDFLKNKLFPFYEKLKQKLPDAAELDLNLQDCFQTLSPSDFGFHNALFQKDGAWVFVDFEYFGWDDPCKLISDVVLHPAMQLSSIQQRDFVEAVIPIFRDDPELGKRFALQFPLWGLKWCAIILNEFIPDFLARRVFAGTSQEELIAVQKQQLTKAERMLDSIFSNYEHLKTIFES